MDSPPLTEDNRQFQRIPFVADVYIELGKLQWQCKLLDISLKGFLVEPPSNVDPQTDTNYSISLILSNDVAICSRAEIIHYETRYWGFQWVDIDIDSFTSLRRLLEHNMADPEQIYRELAELMEGV